ncbi:MAG TPA: four helix bundle protein, partial [Chitinophagaceae bacterium]
AENKNFCYYSRGSAFETLTAIKKAKERNLIADNEILVLTARLNYYFKLIGPYIRSIGQNDEDPVK